MRFSPVRYLGWFLLASMMSLLTFLGLLKLVEPPEIQPEPEIVSHVSSVEWVEQARPVILEASLPPALALAEIPASELPAQIRINQKPLVAVQPVADLSRPSLALPLPGLPVLEVAKVQPILSEPLLPLVRVSPRYPHRAKRAKIEGWVKVALSVRADGFVEHASVVQAEPENIFDEAALEAVRQWQFQPKKLNGQPVGQKALQTIEFLLATK